MITPMVSMVLIGRSKFGQNNRISLVEGLPDIMNLEVGDYVEFHIVDGELILRKETKKYKGFDFETDEIKDKLIKLEQSRLSEEEDEGLDPELAEKKAREQYFEDKKQREKKRQLSKNS